MPATYAIAEIINAIVMTLDPVQRWQAPRRFNGSWITQKWFIIIALLTLTILISIILITSLYKSSKKHKTENLVAANLAQHKGLSPYEIQILKNIADNSGYKNKIEVFTSKKVFDDSLNKIINKQKQSKDTEKTKKLEGELNLLREKLGFQETEHNADGTELPQKTTTKQIPTGKILYIQTTTSQNDEIKSTVIENTKTELTVKLETHPRINFTEKWRGRYSFEGFVCEFDTSVISYDGNCLVLSHSENVLCYNRRRFVRKPAEHQALAAPFPEDISANDKNLDNKTDTEITETSLPNRSFVLCPPEFLNATVTETGGPGLKLKTDLEARKGDRILIILKLGEQKILQDIAVVRRTEQNQDGHFLAAEMFGMSDEFIEELVHATNTAPTKEPQEKNDNTDNTNTNEENQQENIIQEA